MASNAANPPAKASPLAFMTRISPSAYVYTPSPSSSGNDSNKTAGNNDPKLIILATWMGARDLHIAKYLQPYLSLYPSSSILLLRSEPRHFFSKAAAPGDVGPAAPFVKSLFLPSPSQIDSEKPRVLIHVWSNGGSLLLHHLRLALTTQYLPKYVIIYDSCPGQYRYMSTFRAFSAGLSGILYWIAAPVLHLFCAWGWFWHVLIGKNKTGPLAYLNRGHNDFEKLGQKEVRRGYIYSEGDELVHWSDVEAHAEEAKKSGFKEVRLEKFTGTGHVAHGKGEENQKRYWGLVRGLWESSLAA